VYSSMRFHQWNWPVCKRKVPTRCSR